MNKLVKLWKGIKKKKVGKKQHRNAFCSRRRV